MFRSILTSRLQAAFDAAGIAIPEGLDVTVALAADTRFGDYQSNAPMILAKQLKTNPRALATQVVEKLEVSDLCEKVAIDGPGFLNFRISPLALATKLQVIVNEASVGVSPVEKPQTIVVDFSAPNIAKPMHVGHIRSTFIGDSLARVARFVGHKVITDNHVGDWGTQFGMIIHGWKTQLNQEALKVDPIHELVRVYKFISAATKTTREDEEGNEVPLEPEVVANAQALRATCKAELVKLQSGDAENLGIWKECVRLTLEQLERVYTTLDIKFDYYLGESFFNDALAPLVEDMLAKGVAVISEGAAVVMSDGSVKQEQDPFLSQRDGAWVPAPCIIRKGDGGFGYATTDLATIDYRVNEWKADEIWYVVGVPQQLHFRQVFAAAQRRGVTTKMIHIGFGSILGPDGKMFKTRSGETVGLLEVIEEAIDRAAAATTEREKILAEETIASASATSTEDAKALAAEVLRDIAKKIGIACVKYAELSQNRLTDYKFSWDKMLSLHGNTAPYLMNAFVRVSSIGGKLGIDWRIEPPPNDCALTEPAEIALAIKLAQFAETVYDVLADHRPNLLANYLFELSNTFHSFYEACHVLNSKGIVLDTRKLLCQATYKVLAKSLDLLGIQTTERM